jgi:hypothetical protein
VLRSKANISSMGKSRSPSGRSIKLAKQTNFPGDPTRSKPTRRVRAYKNCRAFCLRKNSLQRPHTTLFLVVKTATAHLPISPSKTLVKFADQIASFGKGPVIDAPFVMPSRWEREVARWWG